MGQQETKAAHVGGYKAPPWRFRGRAVYQLQVLGVNSC